MPEFAAEFKAQGRVVKVDTTGCTVVFYSVDEFGALNALYDKFLPIDKISGVECSHLKEGTALSVEFDASDDDDPVFHLKLL